MLEKNKTQKVRAEEIGISQPALRAWIDAGVNVWDDDAVREKLARNEAGKLPPNLNPEFRPTGHPDDLPPAASLDEIQERLLACTSDHDARLLKIQADGIRSVIKARKEDGEVIPISEVKEMHTRVGVAVRMAIMALEGILPPRLEGLDPGAMSRIIREETRKVLEGVADGSPDFWITDNEYAALIEYRSKTH